MRLHRVAALFAASTLSLATACTIPGASPAPKRLWLVLVDASLSIDTKTANTYTAAWHSVVDMAAPGDQVTLLRIGTGVRSAALPVADVVLPTAPSLWDNALRRRREIGALKARLRSVPLIERRELSRDTPILEALQTAGRRLGERERERHVVLMSDMIEDAGALDFLKRPPDDDDLAEQSDAWGEANETPAWQAVKVHVVYAGAPVNDRTARAIERFWRGFFAAIGAELRSWDAQLPRETTSDGGAR